MGNEPRPPLQHNPYAAPLADTEMIGEPTRHFGLKQTVWLEGTKTVDDMVRAVGVVRGKGRWLRPLFAAALLLFIWQPEWSVGQIPLGQIAWGAGLCLYLAYALYWAPRRYRRQLAELLGEGKQEKYGFGEQALECIDSHSAAEFQWERFSGYREIPDYLLLRFYDCDEYLVIPRRYSSSETDWNTVLGLLDYKVPLWEGSKPPPTQAPSEPAAAEAAVVEGIADAADPDTILAAGQATPSEMRRALRLVQPWWFLKYLYTLAAVGLAFWLLFELQLATTPVIIVVIVLAKLLSQIWIQHNLWKEKRAPYEWQTWQIRPEGIRMSTPTMRQSIAWSVFRRVIVRRWWLVLETAGGGFFLVMRRYFRSEKDWERTLEIVRTQRAEQQRGS